MSNVSELKRCPKCGGPIPAEAPQGLCPKCLFQQVCVPTETGKAKSAPPTSKELAAAFPQLEILELIGQGGMGFVFKARQPKLDRFVALKVLPQSLAADPAFAERFTREGRMLARLNHPNIVAIHDFGQAGGYFYLLMEFVDGVNLRQAMKVGRFTPAQALSVVPKICEALQFAHNEGILHRDIKPENILLDGKGRVKIADFGIAKLVGENPPDDAGAREVTRPLAASLTEMGKVLGTPQYMAPEQLEHPRDVDQRADIYSLGVVFYEMLTGELPLGRFALPSEKSAVDPRVDEVVLRALEKERERRQNSAGEVRAQVETIAATPGPGSSRPVLCGITAEGGREEIHTEAAKSRQVWWTWSFLNSREVDEICGHLTKAEKYPLVALHLIAGAWYLLGIFGIPVLMQSSSGSEKLFRGLVAVFVFVVSIPMIDQLWQHFYCATSWAKARGLRPEQLRLYSFNGILRFAVFALVPVMLFVHNLARINWPNNQPQQNSVRARQPVKPAAPSVVFGPVIERTIHLASTGTNFLLSFRTGDLRTPPPEFASSNTTAIYQWSQREGVDAGAGILNTNVLSGFDMAALPAPVQCWEELTPTDAVRRLDSEPLDSWKIMLNGNTSPPETCAFKTREGGIGILQLTGFVSDPPGLKIRYKFVDKVPATKQTESNTVAARSWSPTLWPGEKPDLRKILDEVRDLTSTSHYEEALQRCLWYDGHARKFDSNSSVALIPVLYDWVELGRRYPKAKQALMKIRDQANGEFLDGGGYSELFQKVALINGQLQNDDATYALFKSIQDQDPSLARGCYFFSESILVKHGDYELCLNYMGDPQGRYESARYAFERERGRISRPGSLPVRSERFLTNGPTVPSPMPIDTSMRRISENRFVGQVCELIEILVGAARKADAEKIRDQAVMVLDDARLKSAVSDAEERVRKVRASPRPASPESADRPAVARSWGLVNTNMVKPSASVERWAPSLGPGEKPNFQKMFQDAKDLMAKDNFEDALQRHLWYHNHALEYSPSQSGVRLSFWLSDWVELGRRFPKARQALLEIRDLKTREFAEGRGYSALFHDVQSINYYLQADEETYALFKTIQQRDADLAQRCYFYIEDLLARKGEYELCLSYLGDPQNRFASSCRSWEMGKQMWQRQRQLRQAHPSPTNIPTPLDMNREADKRFVGGVRQLIEILVGAGHQSEAETIRRQAVELLKDPGLESAVSDAEKKTGKKS